MLVNYFHAFTQGDTDSLNNEVVVHHRFIIYHVFHARSDYSFQTLRFFVSSVLHYPGKQYHPVPACVPNGVLVGDIKKTYPAFPCPKCIVCTIQHYQYCIIFFSLF